MGKASRRKRERRESSTVPLNTTKDSSVEESADSKDRDVIVAHQDNKKLLQSIAASAVLKQRTRGR